MKIKLVDDEVSICIVDKSIGIRADADEKIEVGLFKPKYLQTNLGFGYMFGEK